MASWPTPLIAALAARIAREHAERRGPLLVAIAGAQGSGKTTLARDLVDQLERTSALAAMTLSLDDCYLTAAERAQLAARVHPLLATRGVPGTHDLTLAHQTLDALLSAGAGERVQVPAFDKARDDRRPRQLWPGCVGPLAVVVLEGVCLGALPQSAADLARPCNQLERDEDPAGVWRQYVNEQLAGPYQRLFGRIDVLIFLAAPSLNEVRRWRSQQEAQLCADSGTTTALASPALMARFVDQFERITRTMLTDLPARADVVVALGPGHQVVELRLR